jgi:hypothetical protein
MADSALFIGFGGSVRGRERQALTVLAEALEYFSRLQKESQIESFEPVSLGPHGGELDGFILLRGDQDQLARIRGSDEFHRLITRGELIADNLAVIDARLGDRLNAELSVFTQQLDELT